jgi:hypothetical protein
MKPKLQQEAAEIAEAKTEKLYSASLLPLLPPVQMPFDLPAANQ